MTIVPMNALAGGGEALLASQLEACERVLRSGWWILGKEVASFEEEWAQWLKTPHAVGCANGLDAIEIGLRALNIGPNDEVITTTMTAFATVLGILRAGATPVFADIEASTGMLAPDSVRRCITKRTRAVVLVHLYGQLGAAAELQDLCREHDLHLIEDCAQAHGARSRDGHAGSFGIFAAWSFYPTKNLGAVGDGGALTTASSDLAQLARSLRNYGQTTRYHHPILGLNSRLDELQAALLRTRLTHLNEWTERRRQVAVRYSTGLSNPHVEILPLPVEPERHVHHLFVVLTAYREQLQVHLKSRGIESLIHYPIPVHQQEPCRHFKSDPHGLVQAERHAQRCLSVPCHPYLSENDVQQVITALNDFQV
jgi:dTDP-4-amino-4,6-dideoxygalactose transaminase